MRIVTKEIEVFDVDDVRNDEFLKEKVIEKYRDFNVDFNDWHDEVLAHCKEELKGYGFWGVDINYSGFWSQGDGASFTADGLYWLTFAKQFQEDIGITGRELKMLVALDDDYDLFEFSVKRRKGCRYYHEDSVYVDSKSYLYKFEWSYPRLWKRLCEIYESLNNVLEDYVQKWNIEIYRALEEEYDYLRSDEAVLESLDNGGYEFLEDGTIY